MNVRSHFGSGAPAEGYCDLCQTDLRPARADIDHVIFECGHAELAAVSGHTAAYRRTSKIKAHPKVGAPGVSAAPA